LSELIQPKRIEQIKSDFVKKTEKSSNIKSPYLLDILDNAEGEGCASCFV